MLVCCSDNITGHTNRFVTILLCFFVVYILERFICSQRSLKIQFTDSLAKIYGLNYLVVSLAITEYI